MKPEDFASDIIAFMDMQCHQSIYRTGERVLSDPGRALTKFYLTGRLRLMLERMVAEAGDADSLIAQLPLEELQMLPAVDDVRTAMNAVELMGHEFPEARFAVSGVIPEGLSILAAKPKQGKSWLALQVAVSISKGATALGSYPCDQGAVLYLALEDGLPRLKRRLVQMGASPSELAYFQTVCPRLDEGGFDYLNDWLVTWRGKNPRLVIVDTFAHFRPRTTGRQSAYETDTDALRPLHGLAKEHRVAVLVIHHLRKGIGEDWLDTVSGTAGLAGVADSTFVLERKRGDSDAILRGTGRDIHDLEIGLSFDEKTGLWALSNSSVSYLEKSTAQRDILDALEAAAGVGLRSGEISRAIGRTPQATNNLIQRLVESGEVAQLDGPRSAYVLRRRQ